MTPTEPPRSSSLPETLRELWQLLVAYARQETVDPLRGLGRYLGFGLGGSLLMGLGVILVVLGGLRLLQTETESVFDGNWSWAPYAFGFVLALVVIGIAGYLIGREPKRRV